MWRKKMTSKRSLTITGLVVLVVGFILERLGLPLLAEGALETTISTLITLVGAIMTFAGRYRQGDINIFGKKKVKTETPIV